MNLEPGIPNIKEAARIWMSSNSFNGLSRNSQRHYSTYVKLLAPVHEIRIDRIKGSDIFPILNRMSNTMGAACAFASTFKSLNTFAISMGWMDHRVEIPFRKKRSEPGKAWDMNELKVAIAIAGDTPLGRGMNLALYTAQRIGDVLECKWSQYDGDSILFIQGKTKHEVRVPVAPEFKLWLDGLERASEFVIGRELKYEQFEYLYRKQFPAPEYPTFHQIRHAAATRLAELGATPHEIQGVTGHRDLGSVTRYTAKANMYDRAKGIMKRF